MKTCENCSCENDGSYGSGRFCSVKCSRGFSTKANRKEINEKVSKKLMGTGNSDIKKKCVICKRYFIIKFNKRNQITCSNKCSAVLRNESKIYKEKLSIGRINAINRGVTNGNGIKCKYKLIHIFLNNKININQFKIFIINIFSL